MYFRADHIACALVKGLSVSITLVRKVSGAYLRPVSTRVELWLSRTRLRRARRPVQRQQLQQHVDRPAGNGEDRRGSGHGGRTHADRTARCRPVRRYMTANSGAPRNGRCTDRSAPGENFRDVQVVVAAPHRADADLVVARSEDVGAVDARAHERAVDRSRRGSASYIFAERAPAADLVGQVRVVVDAVPPGHVAAVSFSDGVQIGSHREAADPPARALAVREGRQCALVGGRRSRCGGSGKCDYDDDPNESGCDEPRAGPAPPQNAATIQDSSPITSPQVGRAKTGKTVQANANRRAIRPIYGDPGNVTMKVEPLPSSLWASTRPPCCSATCFTMARPSPVPPVSRERARSTL
jgi:hypothetical protein